MRRAILTLTLTTAALAVCVPAVAMTQATYVARERSVKTRFETRVSSGGNFAWHAKKHADGWSSSDDSPDFRSRAPAPWITNDPADSLYREARAMLNRSQYRRAAELFRELRERYPNSGYAADSFYWEAFALYRINGTEELRAALRALDTQKARFANASTQADAAALTTRIVGALAGRGDSDAQRRVTKTADTQTACDREEMAVRVEALNALANIQADTATAILRRVLQRRDECSATLRKRAVFLLAKQGDPAVAELLLDAARNDPSESVRQEAIAYMSRVPGDAGLTALEQLLAAPDERAQRAAASALAMHESPRARQMLRALVERETSSEALRAEAIHAMSRKKGSAQDFAYLRTLYGRLNSQRLKETTLGAISRSDNPENAQWLLGIARNAEEPMRLRATALSRFARSEVPIADLVRLYDEVSERELKEQLMSVYGRRREPEATDKLIAIARSRSDPQLRRHAISILTRKNDPRTTQLLMEILDQ
ncbi:MAG TPA: HEAT repeat domain-containing protein [Gemmatimonadaceae bacterium]|nr:HEAT repeat domain-containing protein [Gemmatimonadaceae bacterium]